MYTNTYICIDRDEETSYVRHYVVYTLYVMRRVYVCLYVELLYVYIDEENAKLKCVEENGEKKETTKDRLGFRFTFTYIETRITHQQQHIHTSNVRVPTLPQ